MSVYKRLSLLSMLILLSAAAFAQIPSRFDGSWRGDISVDGQTIPIVFNISGFSATADSPAQMALALPLERVEYSDGTVTLRSESLQLTFTGARINSRCISGIFVQRGFSVPLTLYRCEPLTANRPQEPQPPYPYRVEDVEFANADGLMMQGTLTMPADGVCLAAAVLVTGSGTQNRDEEIFGHKPFKLLADRLTRRGIAVLRYDDREFTARRYDGATTADYASDALSAAAYIRSRDDVETSKLGIIGHSEGGTIAFMCAAYDDDIEFVVSLAGMTVSGADCLLEQNRLSLVAGGADVAEAESVCNVINMIFESVKGMAADDIRSGAAAIADRAIASSPHPEFALPLREHLVGTLSGFNEWLAWFVSCEPAVYISKIHCRVLALNGSKDVQVDADANLGRLREFPNLSGLLDARKYEGLNHMFQHCASGSVSECAMLSETFSEEVAADIADWILSADK